MRILHIFDHSVPLQTGYTFRSRAILEHQRQLGYETFHLTSPKHEIKGQSEDEVDGLLFHRTPDPEGWMSRLPGVREIAQIRATARRAIELAEKIKPDLIHAHSPVLNGLAALWAAKKLNLPLVYEIRAFWEDAAASHGDCREGDLRYRTTRWLESFVCRRADAVMVICDGLYRDLLARGIAADKLGVIPNAVDVARFNGPTAKDEALAAELGLSGKTVLGFLGSFYDYEGLDILIDAIPMLLEKRGDIALLLTGGGYVEQALRAQVARLGLEGKVIFTGRVANAAVERYYALVDILVYPRKNIRLTDLVTPLKPLEAMAQHKLVAASDIGGHRELIRDGDTGILFPPDDPAALADALLGLLERRAEWPGFLERGRAFVERERTWKRSVANYVPVYERLASRRNR